MYTFKKLITNKFYILKQYVFFSQLKVWSFINLHTDPGLARKTWNSLFFWFTTYRAAKLEHWLDCCRPRISGWRTSPRRSEFQNQVNALSQTTEYLKQVLSNYCQRQNVNALRSLWSHGNTKKRVTDMAWLLLYREKVKLEWCFVYFCRTLLRTVCCNLELKIP